MGSTEYKEGRRRELAKIHIAKKQLGLDDATYRAILMNIAGVESSADLDAKSRKRVIAHFVSSGFQPTRGKTPHPGTPHNFQSGNSRQLRLIEALLSELQKPWSYADAIAKRMYGVERIAWCKPKHLNAVISALKKNKSRQQKRSKK